MDTDIILVVVGTIVVIISGFLLFLSAMRGWGKIAVYVVSFFLVAGFITIFAGILVKGNISTPTSAP